MYIAVEARQAYNPSVHGWTIYLRNLIRGLTQLDNCIHYALLVDSRPRDGFPEVGPHAEVVQIPKIRGLKRLTRNPDPWWELLIPIWLSVRRPDVVLGNAHKGPPRRFSGKYVAYVLDTAYLDLPEYHSEIHKANNARNAVPALRRADLIIAISETTRAAAIRNYGLDPGKVFAVPLAYDRDRFNLHHDEAKIKAVRTRYGITEPYILFVGRLAARKNLPRLVQAFGRLKQSHHIPHKLVLAGKPTWGYKELVCAIQEHCLDNEVLLPGFVPEDDLPDLLRGADMFVFPSLYEGFGIPILEAMACGVPVVASNVTSLPEVAGDAALMVDPYDVDALANAIAQVIEDPALRTELVDKGLVRVQQFSWQQTAQQTLGLITGLL